MARPGGERAGALPVSVARATPSARQNLTGVLMNFGFTEEQEMLRSEVRRVLDADCPMDEVRRIAELPAGYDPGLWMRIAELGGLGIPVAERHGGAGLGWVDLTVVLEETGRSLFPSPLVATSLAMAAIESAGSPEQRDAWLPELVSGERIGTLALLEADDRIGAEGIACAGRPDGDDFVLSGEKRFVADAGAADRIVVAFRAGSPEGPSGSAGLSLALVENDAAGVTAENQPGIDATKRIGRIVLDEVRVTPAQMLGAPGRADATVARLLDLGAAAVTAEAIGAAEGAHALTCRYVKERVQFGSPIGRFQGVKHPLAEMYVDIESAKSLLYYAVWALDRGGDDASAAVSRAKAYVSDAFARIGIDTIQLHGGIGYTWEYDAHLYLKRSKWVRPMYGDADFHYERVARLGGL